MLKPEQRILLVLSDPREVKVVQRHLLGIGVEGVFGYLQKGCATGLRRDCRSSLLVT